MAAVELRVWVTTEGIDIPFFKVPYTRATLYSAIDGLFSPVKAQLYQYPNYNSGNLLANPYLDDMRWIARKVFMGWNPRNAVAFAPAGTFRWSTTAGPSTMAHAHAPGAASWVDMNNWEALNSPGATVPPWMGTAMAQIRPYPGPLFGWQDALSSPLGSVYIQTSDNLLARLDFDANFNVFGWQSWYVSRTAPSTADFPTDITTMISRLVETSEDQGEDVARFNPRTAPSTIGCYVMNKGGLLEFLKDLWTTDLIESIRTAFIGDGSNALLGVKWFYGIRDKISIGSSQAHVTMGNVAFESITTYPVAIKEFVEFDMGSVVVPQFYGDFRDWTATSYQIYLPFIGMVDLSPKDIVGKTLYLKYWINITDGSAVCTVSTTPSTPDGTGTIFTTTCSWGYDIPVRVDSAMDALARTVKMVTGGAAGFLGEAGAYSSGELSPNSNVMGDFQAKLIVHRREDLSGVGFAEAEGAPGAAATTVGASSGYLKASTVYNAGSLAMRRSGEIVAMLQEGIYI